MLKAHDIVKLWEVASGKPTWQKAILILAASSPNEPMENLALQSLGMRNVRLFRLRDKLFGTNLSANTSCTECGEAVEFQLDSQVICNPELPPIESAEINLEIDEYSVLCRPVNSYDLRDVMPIMEIEGIEGAEAELVHRCTFRLSRDGVMIPVESLSPEVLGKVAEGIKDADIHSEILCRLNCPECSHTWPEPFDIAKFLWQELELKAKIILSEVQLLAKAFGWWEGDILSLSDVRRKYYLEALNA